MSDYGEVKYKWTPESTSLLVSVWTDKQVQKQLDYAPKPQLIWESVAKYMKKKGYAVSGKQCRSRMKQVLVCYREAKKIGTRAGVERYYDSIDQVLKSKKGEDTDGVDTVDSAIPLKSPPKDVKTNKNNRMRFAKFNEPMESRIRTDALSPTWQLAHEEEYPDSPESNETVLAQPFRTFSPTRDAATNTIDGRSRLPTKGIRRSLTIDERPIKDPQVQPNNRFGELVYQNAVQNVQNQIIQESMQQRNFLRNQYAQDEAEMFYRRNAGTRNPCFTVDDAVPTKLRFGNNQRIEMPDVEDPILAENAIRAQNQLQRTCPIDNRAMPQEPRRVNIPQTFSMNCKPMLYKDVPISGYYVDDNNLEIRQRAANYSPDTAANLNEAFYQTQKNDRNDNLNDSYDRPIDNDVIRGMNATTITNNATFNDDTLSIEFLENSPSPSDNGALGGKSLSGNSDRVPSVPLRKKKVQKLEQLMLNAITSQSDVVNKILAAQDAMVSRFLDLDRDRHNRLENRLEQLLTVVHSTVLNKSPEKESDKAQEPVITSLAPPPRPGVVPPKLDLVPPKPCRVPCTSAHANIELVNQKAVETRPGMVSPIKQPGAIWSKLGPVSQSPFVKAQRQLGFSAPGNNDARTQSSAERKIAREMAGLSMDRRAIAFETDKFLQVERQVEECAENARVLGKMAEEAAAPRRKLFATREPNPGVILTAAFLDAERYASSLTRESPRLPGSTSDEDEELALLASQVENYERLRRLNDARLKIDDRELFDTSTPAKAPGKSMETQEHKNQQDEVPRQTIQQLAELVMKSARWKEAAAQSNMRPAAPAKNRQGDVIDNGSRPRSYAIENAQRDSREKALGWLQDRYSYGDRPNAPEKPIADQRPPNDPSRRFHPMGFTMENIIRQVNDNPQIPIVEGTIGFNPEILVRNVDARRSVGFVDLEAPRAIAERNWEINPRRNRPSAGIQEKQRYFVNDRSQYSTLPLMHKNMIDRYIHENGAPVFGKRIVDQESDEDEVFLDTTNTMHDSLRKTSLTSNATSSGRAGNCVVS